ERMAQVFELPREERDAFIRAARAQPEPEPIAAAGEAKAKTAPPREELVAHPAPRPLAPLPIPPTAFIGREAELATLAHLLSDPDCRRLPLTGPGGIGKTRLALEAAARHSRAFADGVAFAPLNSVGTVDQLAPAIADALGFGLSEAVVLTGQILGSLRE